MAENFQFGGEIVWRPSAEDISHSNLSAFMKRHGIGSFAELMHRSTDDIAWFTEAVLEFLNIRFDQPYSQVVDLSRGVQFPRWCVDGKMNIAANCVNKWAAEPDTRKRPAVLWEGEDGTVRSLTYKELSQEVNRCANALRTLGFGKGEVIGLCMPMTPEIVIALLAVAKIGAIILPLFSGFGAQAIVTRLADAEASGLFTADGFFRRGRPINLKHIADDALSKVPTVRQVIVLKHANLDVPLLEGRDHWWHDLIPPQSAEATCEPTAAEDPVMLIYTSGTTGKPKGTVHTHCGFPVKAAQDMAFGTDIHPGDIIYWMTDMGWMMGPWLVFGSTLLGAACFLYDGAPDYPTADRLWRMVETHHINIVGLAPTFVRLLIRHGEELIAGHDLSSLRAFASTSEPWDPESWLWLFEKVGQRKRPIINYSGGTEISGGIVMGNPLLPLKPAAFSAPCPGIAADVVDEEAKSVRNEVGELVIKKPWIGMTRSFWRDDQRYLNTYWSRWENVWVHVDWAAVDEDNLWYILGRSDDTIKVAGKRVGPAEVEAILVSHDAVTEAAVIGIPHTMKGSEVVGFCVLKPEIKSNNHLATELQTRVAQQMGHPLRPAKIEFVQDLPKTRNLKIMRRIIRSAYLGESVGDISSLVNPEAVEEIGGLR